MNYLLEYSVYSVLGIVILAHIIEIPVLIKMRRAKRAQEDGRYSEAYQIYNSLIIQYSKKKKLLEIKEIPITATELMKIVKNVATNYASYRLKKPSIVHCHFALQQIYSIKEKIIFIENIAEVTSKTKLNFEEYCSIWKKKLFYDQEILPTSVENSLQKLYTQDFCLVYLIGGRSTYFEGVFFNPAENICLAIEKRLGSFEPMLYAMKNGDWECIMRINTDRSDPIDKNFYQARQIEGRWYSSPIKFDPRYNLFTVNLYIQGPSGLQRC
jgi:hypothetical protein